MCRRFTLPWLASLSRIIIWISWTQAEHKVKSRFRTRDGLGRTRKTCLQTKLAPYLQGGF